MKQGWEEKKLGEVGKASMCKRIFKNETSFTGDIPFYKIGTFGKKPDAFITKDLYNEYKEKYRFPKKGDVLISASGTIGRTVIYDGEPAYFQDSNIVWIDNNETVVTNKYLFNFYRNVKWGEEKGATISRLYNSNLEKIKIRYPESQKEQKRIVTKLDKCFESINKACVNVEKNLNNAKELFQSQLNQIFSQKGDGWVEKILDEIGETQTGTTPSTKDKFNYGDFIPFVKPPHFKPDGSIDTGNSMLSESGLKIGRLFPPNSVLMVCIGATIGKTGFTETAVSSNQQINCLTPNENYYPKLFYYGLISPFVQKQVADIGRGAQATLPIINKTKWQGLRINIPESKSEQIKIVKQLDELKDQTQSLESNYQQELDALDELKKSIMQKAFNGEL